MTRYIADTTVLIDHLRGRKEATEFLKQIMPHISTVTIVELIQGSKDKRQQNSAIKTCSDLSEIVIDTRISKKALELMKERCLSHGLQFLDSIIAATAITNKMVLVSNNIKHFGTIPGLKVVPHAEAFSTLVKN